MSQAQNTLKRIRRSPAAAADIIRKLVPERHLKIVLQAVAHAVQIAHQAAPSKWGLRLNGDSVMLKVGFPEVLQFREGWFHEVAFRDMIPSKLRRDRRLSFSEFIYRNAKGCDGCDMTIADVAKLYPALRRAHEEAILIAARSPRRHDTPRDHSPGLIVFLSEELGVRLPQPEYFDASTQSLPSIPEELPDDQEFEEGAVSQILVNRYERAPRARESCIERYGTACAACGRTLAEQYGGEVEGLIHVHHLTPVSSLVGGSATNPVRDLRPVCPNCHAVIHSIRPPRSIDEVKAMVRKVSGVRAAGG